MSSPPPFPSSDDEKEVTKEQAEEPEELFAMASSEDQKADEPVAVEEPPAKALDAVDLNASPEPVPEAVSPAAEPPTTAAADDDDDGDLFADAPTVAEPAAASPMSSATTSDESPSKAESVPAEEVVSPAMAAEPEEVAAELEEEYDSFSMDITVKDPEKVGDGMGAYVVYQVVTKSNMPGFKSATMTVRRRFSDFLALQQRLSEAHLKAGRLIPPAPEKSVVGMAKTKFSKDEKSQQVGGSQDFIERRRAALERFLNRTALHPALRKDGVFLEFLQSSDELPKAADTSALSGAGVMRLFKGVGDAFVKMTSRKTETDRWFEEKVTQYTTLEETLKKLHISIESLVTHRRDLCTSTAAFAKSSAILGNTEEHTSLSRVLSQLADVEEKIEQMHMQQVESDFFIFGELIKDYIGLMQPLKACFAQREKAYQAWQTTQANLLKKREQEGKFQAAGNQEKVKLTQEEIAQLETRVAKGEEEFNTISKMMRSEIERFEVQRQKDFKTGLLQYMEKLMRNQEQLIKHWEGFLPEAKAIA